MMCVCGGGVIADSNTPFGFKASVFAAHIHSVCERQLCYDPIGFDALCKRFCVGGWATGGGVRGC